MIYGGFNFKFIHQLLNKFLNAAVEKVTGKEEQEEGAAAYQSPVDCIVKKRAPLGNTERYEGIPCQVSHYMTNEKCNHTGYTELDGVQDIAEPDGCPPYGPVRIGNAH